MTYKHFLRGAILLMSLSMASNALAYISPEDVLLNKELYLPPTKRASDDRVSEQSRESADRREREQEILFGAQHSSEASSVSAVPMPVEGNGSAPEVGSLSSEDLKLLQTIRLLDRVQRNQQVVLYGDRMLPMQADSLHGGAPLAPTGAGGILSGLTMVGAIGWTLLRAKKGKVMIAR
jgi:hypothetical protein